MLKLKTSHELISKIIKIQNDFKNIKLNEKIQNHSLKDYPELYNFAHNDKQILQITNLLIKLKSQKKIKDSDILNYLSSLLSPKTHYGFLSELLSLSYLDEHNVSFDVEVKVDSVNILSKNTVSLDGYIEEIDTYFDIKGFGLQEYARISFARFIEKQFQDNSVLISGNYDVSYKDIEKFAFSNKNQIIADLKETGKSFINELNWDIKLSDKKIQMSIGEMTPYRSAEENKNFIFRKCSQFTINSPFLLICTFDNLVNLSLVNNFASHTCTMTRSLARRAFMEFNKVGLLAKDIDPKCKTNITLSQASKYLSGILFLDTYNNKSWLYLNPNAINKLDIFNLECAFDFRLPYEMTIDDFKYDNY